MRATVAIAGQYLLYFGTVGILLPFLPAYLKTLDLSATEVGVLIGVGPVLTIVAPPFWGHLADRTGRPDRILTTIALGACACFAPLLATERFAAILVCLAAYAFFASSVSTVLDGISLRLVAGSGGSYARLRLFGSLGFVVASSSFGLAVDAIDRSTVVVAMVLMGAQIAWSLTLRGRATGVTAPVSPLAGLDLLRRPELALFLCASCLHWIAAAPYHGIFSIHVGALALPPWVVGLSMGLGVIVEMGVMFAYPRFAGRIAARHLLAVSFAGSAARWAGMALTSEAAALIALSLLHGLTFGAFFVASVAYVARRVPDSLRATGQAMFVSATFGVGGVVGYVSAGAGYDLLGGHRLFAVAAGLEIVAAILAWRLPPPAPSAAIPRRS